MEKFVLLLVLVGVASGAALGLSFYGTWDTTIEILPTLRIYRSNLVLNCVFAPGWRIESETKIYAGGVFKYQNFYIDGAFGEFDVWGKIYFHAEEVRYQKAWVNAETQIGPASFRLSFNHWSTSTDYTSYDEELFGPWPCVNVVSWDEAWRHIGRTMYVEGPVVGYYYPGYLKLNIGVDFPNPYRFEVYIPSARVAEFEEKFGDDFWVAWVARNQVICVYGQIKGYRWTTGGPRDEGYSVAQIQPSSPSDIVLGECCGYPPITTCPGTVIRWFEAHMHGGETLYIQGPVVSITGPSTYHGYSNTYRVRIGGGGGVDNRVEVIMYSNPGWPTVGPSYDREVCVHGKITVSGGRAVILPPDLIATKNDVCCEAALVSGTFLNWRMQFRWEPFKIIADFWDCCTGTGLGRITVEAKSLPFLCCGLSIDGSLTFTRCRGFEKLAFTIRDLPLGCCGLTAKISAEFTPTFKTLRFEPAWPGVSGCFTVYGDVVFSEAAIIGIEIYGFGITCYADKLKLRTITAFNPDKVEDITDVTFYTGEWQYLGLAYTGSGCCGELTLTLESWFGSKGVLFDFQRFRVDLQVPLTAAITVFSKAQWDFADPTPLDLFDVGWKVSF